MSGGFVTIGSQGLNACFQIASTVVLARLLSPSDFGVVAMVLAVTAFAGIFRDLGLSSVTIQKSSLSREQHSNLFWINLCVGILLTLLVASLAPAVSWFYQDDSLALVTVALASNFAINSLSVQQAARLVRDMSFKKQAAATLAGSATNLAVSIYLALKGGTYWSLVWGSIAGNLATTTLHWILSPFRPRLPKRGVGTLGMLKFGAHVTSFDLINYFHRNLDNILIGRFSGSDALGIYSRAYTLLMFPIKNLRRPLKQVAFPALSKLQSDQPAFCSYYRRTTSLLACASMPLTAFMFVNAEPLINIVFGPDWNAVTALFYPLAIASFPMPVSGTRGLIFLSLGKGREYLTHGTIKAAIFSIGFMIGIYWGAIGVAVSYAITTFAVQFILIPYTTRKTFVTTKDLVMPSLAPAVASLLSAIVSILLLSRVSIASEITQILFAALLYGCAYTIALCCFPSGRKNTKLILLFLKSSIQKVSV